MSYQINPRTDKPRNAMLTEAQRAFLESDGSGYNKQSTYDYKTAIRSRIHNTFKDFSLLVEELPDEEREKIFNIEHRTDERREFEQNLSDVIQFIYTGLEGQPAFERTLDTGVRNGEYSLGHVRSPLLASVDFEVDYITPPDPNDVIERIKNDEFNQLNPDEVYQFLQLATTANALDFDAMEEHLGVRHDLATSPPHPGWKRRTAGSGTNLTPLMPPDIFEEEGIKEMSRDELRDQFPHAPYPGRAVYDGEKIYVPSWPQSDEDPTIIERLEDED